jgi:glycosylphosphatidylinositol transamidase
MGLLSDSGLQKKSGDIIIKYSNCLCIILYVVGIIWFCLLSAKPFNASTYFSENALLPGLVQRDFLSDRETRLYYDELQARVTNITDDNDKKNAVLSYVRQKFASIGLAAGDQNFSFQYPFALRNKPAVGSNIYGILRAPRLAGTEAIVINVPYESDKSGSSLPGLALLLGLATTFRRHTYWAKDIIFLVTDYEAIGIQAWTAAYHGNFHEYKQHLSFGELHERSGSIQAAIVLELSTNSISRLNIKFEGYNGQLPNLDLVNTASHLCRHESIPPTVQKRLDPKTDNEFQSSVHSFVTLLSMMSNQISGSATGNHGFFQKYHIEAITLQGVKMKNAKKSFNFGEVGRVIEGIVRSVNNLLERFHQSFFFYLLPATNRYISIGLYMPPFGLLVAAALVKAIALWIDSVETAVNGGKRNNKLVSVRMGAAATATR